MFTKSEATARLRELSEIITKSSASMSPTNSSITFSLAISIPILIEANPNALENVLVIIKLSKSFFSIV